MTSRIHVSFASIAFASFALVTPAALTACVAPTEDAAVESAEAPAVDLETTTEIAANGWTRWCGQGPRKRRCTERYYEAVAIAEAKAENGATATAVAQAFSDALRGNGYWREPCAANAIAVAEAVAIDSCTGARTVARAVASVSC